MNKNKRKNYKLYKMKNNTNKFKLRNDRSHVNLFKIKMWAFTKIIKITKIIISKLIKLMIKNNNLAI